MEITIQIADAVYQQILSNGKRVKCSIGLVNASEGNNIPFNASEFLQVNLQEEREVINPHGYIYWLTNYFIGSQIPQISTDFLRMVLSTIKFHLHSKICVYLWNL